MGFSAFSPSRRRSSHSSPGVRGSSHRGRVARHVQGVVRRRRHRSGGGPRHLAGAPSRRSTTTWASRRRSLQPVAAAARRGCAALSPVGWRNGKADVVSALVDAQDDLVPPLRRRDVSDIARSSVGVRPDVYRWQPAGGRRSPSSTRSSAAVRRHRSGHRRQSEEPHRPRSLRLRCAPFLSAASTPDISELRELRDGPSPDGRDPRGRAPEGAESLRIRGRVLLPSSTCGRSSAQPGGTPSTRPRWRFRRGSCGTSSCRRRSAVPRVATVARSTAIHGRPPGRSPSRPRRRGAGRRLTLSTLSD